MIVVNCVHCKEDQGVDLEHTYILLRFLPVELKCKNCHKMFTVNYNNNRKLYSFLTPQQREESK